MTLPVFLKKAPISRVASLLKSKPTKKPFTRSLPGLALQEWRALEDLNPQPSDP